MILILQLPDILYGVTGVCAEVDLSIRILKTRKNMFIHFLNPPLSHTVVGTCHIGHKLLLFSPWIGISVKAAAQGGGELGIDAVPFEENPVIARAGRFIHMAESGGIITRSHFTGDG